MPNTTAIRNYLKNFEFKKLFIEELGWDQPASGLSVSFKGKEHKLNPVAQKRGVQVFQVSSDGDGHIPDYETRKGIEQQVRKLAHEHLIIFADKEKTVQKWQWVAREPGKPTQFREHEFRPALQSGEAIIQKLREIAFALSEEEALTLMGVTERLKDAFDRAKVTKKFYDKFKEIRDGFAKLVEGIPDKEMEGWYVSVMLNRLMFIYFIQKKNFLNSDPDYLRTKLAESKYRGRDKYYKQFLCPLFFDGFAKRERSADTQALLGDVPYLNGGLFMRHQIEEWRGEEIKIKDSAFEKIFDFFDEYHWHLDDRPLRDDKEINPEVLGYIFEKYINQKQMGAYYTKEDITGYITKNTVIPYLFDAAREKCKIAFEGDQSVWKYLAGDPDKYIYPAVRKGVNNELPNSIAAGIADVSKRTEWNKPAPAEYALPTEIWREVVARRQRYAEVRAKMAAGQISSINDLITYNLDIRQFAQDVIENCEGPELLRAFWKAISKITVLDPTCGSGAFLFAALNILEPLYEACLDRMQNFMDDLEHSGQKHSPEKFKDFKEVLDKLKQHSNQKYFVYKSIIVNNLFGVDIMEEAVEICKLRLFLKLVAQIDDKRNIEPLPDIDFNIRPGNTLIGFANYEDAQRHITSKLDFENVMERIDEQAQDLARLFQKFREQQTQLGGEVTPEDKEALRKRLETLDSELNGYLAREYGVDPAKAPAYKQWVRTHLPFHWYTQFHRIIETGGFDVVVGNPPYVEMSAIQNDYRLLSGAYETLNCGNVYAPVIERCLRLIEGNSRFGMIVPISIVGVDDYAPLRRLLFAECNDIHLSNFGVFPSKLFTGVAQRVTIITCRKVPSGKDTQVFVTAYHKWYESERGTLLERMRFHEVNPRSDLRNGLLIPKHSSFMSQEIWARIRDNGKLGALVSDGKQALYYHRSPNNFVRAHNKLPYYRGANGERISKDQVRELEANTAEARDAVVSVLMSSTFFWWLELYGQGRHVTGDDIYEFPIPKSSKFVSDVAGITSRLMKDMDKNAKRKKREQRLTGTVVYDEYYVRLSKSILDEIDATMARHFGLSEGHLDFVTNYDVKYRMGQGLQDDED